MKQIATREDMQNHTEESAGFPRGYHVGGFPRQTNYEQAMNPSLHNSVPRPPQAASVPSGKAAGPAFLMLQLRGHYGLSSMKTCLATLVLAVGLCGARAFARPSANDEFDPLEFAEYKAKAEQGCAEAQYNLGVCYI